MIKAIETETAFDEMQHQITIKTLSKMGIEETYLNIIMALYVANTQPTLYSMVISIKVFPSRSETSQGCLLSPLLFNIVLEVLVTAIRQKVKIKGIQTGKEEVKLLLLIDNMI